MTGTFRKVKYWFSIQVPVQRIQRQYFNGRSGSTHASVRTLQEFHAAGLIPSECSTSTEDVCWWRTYRREHGFRKFGYGPQAALLAVAYQWSQWLARRRCICEWTSRTELEVPGRAEEWWRFHRHKPCAWFRRILRATRVRISVPPFGDFGAVARVAVLARVFNPPLAAIFIVC